MDKLRQSVMFLLEQYIDVTGTKWSGLLDHIADLKEDDPLREVLQEAEADLEAKLAKAKTYLESLKLGGVSRI